MKLLFLTGSRGEWGYLRPIIKLCHERGIRYNICATNMLLLPAYGSLVEEIKADGFHVSDEIFMSLEGHNHFSMVKSLGIFMNSFVDTLYRVRPDWIVLAGDRGEQLMGAIAGAYTYIPVAHIQAGERSGNIDGVSRHALGKFVHLHFAANEDAAQRLRKLGEESFRIHSVGAPQLDELVASYYTPADVLQQRYEIAVASRYLLVVQHPVTEEMHLAGEQVASLVQALRHYNMPKLWILPNNDAGSQAIRRGLLSARTSDLYVFENLSRQDYLGFMANAACLVGNSSSGLIEAPTFELAAVNLGRRQADRVQGANVINAPFLTEDIVTAIDMALSAEFQKSLRNCVNPYGDGCSSERILDTIESVSIDDRLLIKRMTY